MKSSGDMLTATDRPSPAMAQLAQSPTAWTSTSSVSAPIRPDASASGMNRSGSIRPRVGWCQRASASNPTSRPSSRSIFGW